MSDFKRNLNVTTNSGKNPTYETQRKSTQWQLRCSIWTDGQKTWLQAATRVMNEPIKFKLTLDITPYRAAFNNTHNLENGCVLLPFRQNKV